MLLAFRKRAKERRSARALQRQLDYQRAKALAWEGEMTEHAALRTAAALSVRAMIEAVRPIDPDARVLEVGSGPHGLIFFFGARHAVGVDPLADEYRKLFPKWSELARTVRGFGENLPFEDASFDVVLCDNCVDHAHDPRAILREITRVLRPGGLLYFSVNVHHGVYSVVSRLHGAWTAAGLPFEITPFADHTVHLTVEGARELLRGLPLRTLSERDTVNETRELAARSARRGPADHVKRVFFKNALYEAVAERT